MDRRLLEIILCPACGGTLRLASANSTTVQYADGEREEIESGTASCACGRHYPITNFTLSFAEVFTPLLHREAAYWDRYYLWLLERGSYGFHDLSKGQAPFITFGVPEPFPNADRLDRYNIHHQVAEHPLLRKGRTLLDIGVGLGWTSLYLARAGYAVTAFEPSMGPIVAAKRYAIEQGIFIEYICAAIGAIRFRPCSFDNVTAFHSLHHVPDLRTGLLEIKSWLCPGGAFAIDEHTGNSRLAAAMSAQLHSWAEAEIFPKYRTLPPDALDSLPNEPHSVLEDSSVNEVVPLVSELFKVQFARPRHVFLDHYPLLYYLQTDRDLTAYRHALIIANQLQDLVRQIDPDDADYTTIVAENAEPDPESEAQNPPQAQPAIAQPLEPIETRYAELSVWARELERELGRKNTELVRLRALVRKLENGRIMRLIRLLSTTVRARRE